MLTCDSPYLQHGLGPSAGKEGLLLHSEEEATAVGQQASTQGENVQIGTGHLHYPVETRHRGSAGG